MTFGRRFARAIQLLTWAARLFWVALAPIVLAVATARFVLGPSELSLRVAGYILTLAGAIPIIQAVFGTQRAFGRPGYGARFKEWIGAWRPVLWRPKAAINATAHATAILSLSATGTVTAGARSTSMSERLRLVEAEVRRLDTRIADSERASRSEIQDARVTASEAYRALTERHDALSRRIEEVSAGGLDWQLAGVAWLVAGQAFAAFPVELARWL